MPYKKPMSDAELAAFEASQDFEALLVQSAREMGAQKWADKNEATASVQDHVNRGQSRDQQSTPTRERSSNAMWSTIPGPRFDSRNVTTVKPERTFWEPTAVRSAGRRGPCIRFATLATL